VKHEQTMSHVGFLQLVLADEITRREARSATLRSRAVGLDPAIRLDTWDEPGDPTYDRELLADLATQRCTAAGHGALSLGPVGVGRTHLAGALGHIAIHRRTTVHAARTDKLFTRLRAARLDNTVEAELRRLARAICSSSTTSRSSRSTRPRPTTSTTSWSTGTGEGPRS
jgi:DNA replication protein DnaC